MTQSKRRSAAASMLLSVAAFVVVIACMRAAQGIIVPFLLAGFIAIVGTSGLSRLQRRGVSPVMTPLLIESGIVAVRVSGSIAVCSP